MFKINWRLRIEINKRFNCRNAQAKKKARNECDHFQKKNVIDHPKKRIKPYFLHESALTFNVTSLLIDICFIWLFFTLSMHHCSILFTSLLISLYVHFTLTQYLNFISSFILFLSWWAVFSNICIRSLNLRQLIKKTIFWSNWTFYHRRLNRWNLHSIALL